MNNNRKKQEPSFGQRHFLLTAFVGSFAVAVVFLLGLFIWLGNGREAFAAVVQQCRSVIVAARPSMQERLSKNEQDSAAAAKSLLHFNRLHSRLIECDRRLEQGLEEWRSGRLTLEGLELIAASNRERLVKLEADLQALKLPTSLRSADRSRLEEIGRLMQKSRAKVLHRQEHFSHLLSVDGAAGLTAVRPLYDEELLQYMRLVKLLEFEYRLQYTGDDYRGGLELSQADGLEWVMLAQSGLAAEAGGDLTRAEEIYTVLTSRAEVNSRGAGYMLLAGLRKRQGDYAAYQTLVQQADKFWPGAAEDSGEYAACRRQGLL